MTTPTPTPDVAGDTMVCRSCGGAERASEGYPCTDCGTFICIVCELRGVTRCRECQVKAGLKPAIARR